MKAPLTFKSITEVVEFVESLDGAGTVVTDADLIADDLRDRDFDLIDDYENE